MSSLEGLQPGDPLVVSLGQGKYRHRKVAGVARKWLTDNTGDRYRIADGWGLNGGVVHLAMTTAAWEAVEERERLLARLVSWGWVPRLQLSLPQLRRAAALLSEFESEGNGGRL